MYAFAIGHKELDMKMPAHCAHYKCTKSHCPTLLSSCRNSGYASTFSISHNRLLQKNLFQLLYEAKRGFIFASEAGFTSCRALRQKL